MFYVHFTINEVRGCSKVAQISVDDGPCIKVFSDSWYHLPHGKSHTLHIYQGKGRRARKKPYWTITLSGDEKQYCHVTLFPRSSDPEQTGAPSATHMSNPFTDRETNAAQMEYAVTHMDRGAYNQFCARRRWEHDQLAEKLRNARPVPSRATRRKWLLLTGAITLLLAITLMAESISGAALPLFTITIIQLILFVYLNKK